jgi:hypothetical protein
VKKIYTGFLATCASQSHEAEKDWQLKEASQLIPSCHLLLQHLSQYKPNSILLLEIANPSQTILQHLSIELYFVMN